MHIKNIIKTELIEDSKKDACYHKVKSRYKVWPSAYASGALVKCRKVGASNWGNHNESTLEENNDLDWIKEINPILLSKKDSYTIPICGEDILSIFHKIEEEYGKNFFEVGILSDTDLVLNHLGGRRNDIVLYINTPSYKESGYNFCNYEDSVSYYPHSKIISYNDFMESIFIENKNIKENLTKKPSSETSLKDWFKRKGEPGGTGGWVDCNTCRKDSETGRMKCKSCGRKEGEKRSKYPACRPTPSSCKEYKSTKGDSWGKKSENIDISKNLKYHLDNKIPLSENIFRFGSESYLRLLKETRSLYLKKGLRLTKEDEEFILTNVGSKGIYNGSVVWLDLPFEEGDLLSEADYKGKDVDLNKPMRNSGDGKKYMVYVKDPSSGNVRKITFGDKKGGLTAKVSNPEARKSFSARHNCSDKKDKLSPGYWACRLTKFGHLFGGKTYPGYW